MFQILHCRTVCRVLIFAEYFNLPDHAVFKHGHIIEQVELLKHHTYFCTVQSKVFKAFQYILPAVGNNAARRLLQKVNASDKRGFTAA